MNHTSALARYISVRVAESRKSDTQIAEEVGLEDGQNILMLKNGTMQVPIEKVGVLAKSLNADPVELLTLCLHEYFPDTYGSISEFLDAALTIDELAFVRALRSAVGGPYLLALTPSERQPLNDFLNGLRHRSVVVH